ncbi:MAG: hypothetical protein JSS60_06975 [Verrucomicrobia bacterium]|nr:hypothetical protein [Verrucomicrobiota bacterium]
MAQNLFRLWVVLLVISGGIALWFTGVAMAGSWKFIRLNAHTPASITNLQVRDLSSSRFAIEADYRFEVSGNTYTGKTIFENPQFMNRFAAENYVKLLGARRWDTWYREGNPDISSLEREFPQKPCLQALLTVGVFAYFYFARGMLVRLMG